MFIGFLEFMQHAFGEYWSGLAPKALQTQADIVMWVLDARFF